MPTKQVIPTILLGSPRPANEILRRIWVNPADADAVKSIPVGYAQETVLERNKAVSLIAKMERIGMIPKGEFRVRLFRDGEKKKVAIMHETRYKEIPASAFTLIGKVPTPEDTAKFIETQENYRHDLTLVAQHFLGSEIYSHTDSDLYYKLRKVVILARKLIENKHGGKFTEERVGRRKYYTWSKT